MMEKLYWVELEESNRFLEIPFFSELVFGYAQEWYNNSEKEQVIEYCTKMHVSLDRDALTLKPFWATLAMAVYAWSTLTPDPRMLRLIDEAQLRVSQ
jgi:hypothetical protein